LFYTSNDIIASDKSSSILIQNKEYFSQLLLQGSLGKDVDHDDKLPVNEDERNKKKYTF
jgi:hypothetical protein